MYVVEPGIYYASPTLPPHAAGANRVAQVQGGYMRMLFPQGIVKVGERPRKGMPPMPVFASSIGNIPVDQSKADFVVDYLDHGKVYGNPLPASYVAVLPSYVRRAGYPSGLQSLMRQPMPFQAGVADGEEVHADKGR
jgi:hypothetical protein